MRLSPSYYPEYIEFSCDHCDAEGIIPVDSIEGDDVRVLCPTCDEPKYIKVIED